MAVQGDVFIGRLAKEYPAKTGFKGQLELPGGISLGVLVPYEGKLTEYLKQGIGKTVALFGTIRLVEREDKSKVAVLEAQWQVQGSSIVKYGNLTKDAELRYTQNGKPVTSCTVAVNYYNPKTKQQEADFWNCTLWGNGREYDPAVILAEKGAKGQAIMVHGRLKNNEYKGKIYPELVIDGFQFIGKLKAKGDNSQGDNSQNDSTNWDDLGTEIDIPDDWGDEEVPF